jgi:hypothetical protein
VIFYLITVLIAASFGCLIALLLLAGPVNELRAENRQLRAQLRRQPARTPFYYEASAGDRRRAAMAWHPAGGRR